MERRDFAPKFPLEWALKDVDLAIEAADGGTLPLLAALSGQWHAAVDSIAGTMSVPRAWHWAATSKRRVTSIVPTDLRAAVSTGGPALSHP
jgi:hypothetical protein